MDWGFSIYTQKKTYVIRDNTYNKEEYNNKVHVDDFGKLDPNKSNPEFIFRSNHIVGEEVDLACYLETNDYGFTRVNYGKPYEEIGNKPQQTNVIRPDDQPAQEQVPMQSGETGDLPF
jgi:hypothetical protein